MFILDIPDDADYVMYDALSLAAWLRKRGLPHKNICVTMRHGKTEDAANSKNARRFASIGQRKDGSYNLTYARNFSRLPYRAIYGVLLHELAHAAAGIDGPDAESDADVWILANVPEAGYAYGTVQYTPEGGRRRTARNIEMVSLAFLKRLYKEVGDGPR